MIHRQVSAYIDAAAGYGGLGIRLSRYIKSTFDLQFTPRIVLYKNSESQNYNIPSFSMETGISWKNHIGVFYKYEDIKSLRFDNDPVYSLGLKTGGITAPIATGIGILGLLVIIASLF